MQFRPCIDIHNGAVKQIVGSSLKDEGDFAKENYTSSLGGAYFADMYKKDNLKGGHVILLNKEDSQYYNESLKQAKAALSAFPGGLQIGGGINADNASMFLDAGASHVIVTSYVFSDCRINYDNLKKIRDVVGRTHLVLDLSCRMKDGSYYVVTDRWQRFTDTVLDVDLLDELSEYADEFLIHAVDVEGKQSGIEESLLGMLYKNKCDHTLTYAGGIRSFSDIDRLDTLSGGRINFTIGSALDIFGGELKYSDVVKRCHG